MHVLFLISVELLALFRLCAALIFTRNLILLLMIAFDTETLVLMFNFDVNEVDMVLTMVMVDMMKNAYVVYKPEVLMLDTVEAQLVLHVPFLAQLLLVTSS